MSKVIGLSLWNAWDYPMVLDTKFNLILSQGLWEVGGNTSSVIDKLHGLGKKLGFGIWSRATVRDAVDQASTFILHGYDFAYWEEEVMTPWTPEMYTSLIEQLKVLKPDIRVVIYTSFARQMELLSAGVPIDYLYEAAYGDFAHNKDKIDQQAAISKYFGVPAGIWVNFANPTTATATDLSILDDTVKYAWSKLDGVLFFSTGDLQSPNWTFGDLYLRNWDHIVELTNDLARGDLSLLLVLAAGVVLPIVTGLGVVWFGKKG